MAGLPAGTIRSRVEVHGPFEDAEKRAEVELELKLTVLPAGSEVGFPYKSANPSVTTFATPAGAEMLEISKVT